MNSRNRSDFRICTCSQCCAYETFDPTTNSKVPGVTLKRGVWLSHQKEDQGLKPKRNTRREARAELPDTLGLSVSVPPISESANVEPLIHAVDGLVLGPMSSPQTAESTTQHQKNNSTAIAQTTIINNASDSHEGMNAAANHDMHKLASLETEFLKRKEAFRYPSIRFDSQTGDLIDNPTPPPLSFELNASFLTHYDWISYGLATLETMNPQLESDGGSLLRARHSNLVASLKSYESYLKDAIQLAWDQRRYEYKPNMNFPLQYDCSSKSQFFNPDQALEVPMLFGLITAIILHLITGLSRPGSNFLLEAMSLVIQATCSRTTQLLTGSAENTLSLSDVTDDRRWPFDIRSAIEKFQLGPDLIYYACCPQCSALYKSGSDNRYPSVCTNRRFEGKEECGAQLMVPDSDSVPKRRFVYQPLPSWIAQFLARPGIIDLVKSKPFDKNEVPEIKSDILQADGAHTLPGHDGKPFLDCPAGELRLIFNLNVDWFNPYGSKNAGVQYSVGGIYMVCANLPVHLRYLVENVYLAGLIPGPHEPASNLSELNHFTKPLVDDLLKLYSPGILLTGLTITALTFLVRCALFAVICDLPGYRKLAGFAGTKSRHMCAFCKLEVTGKTNFDVSSWPRWTREELLSAAEEWRDAQTQAERDHAFEKNGVRWSELLRLPYWDPIKHGIVDSMHNLFLGEAQRHCRYIWGMDRSVSPNKGVSPHTPEQQKENLVLAAKFVKEGGKRKLQELRLTYLATLAHDNAIPVLPSKSKKPTKAEYAEALVEWYEVNPHHPLRVREPQIHASIDLLADSSKEVILNRLVLDEVAKDISRMTLPTWLTPPPTNIGSARLGKLKADIWRTFISVNLVITLVRLWRTPGATKREEALLENFLALATAIRWATSRHTSERHIAIFEQAIQHYFKTLLELFSSKALVPNHHATLHLAECLRAFGPVHGWWTFPFERFNGIIQRQKTNNKPSEMEVTFMRKFCQAATIKAIMNSDDGSKSLSALKAPFRKHLGKDLTLPIVQDLLALAAEVAPISLPTWQDKKPTANLPDSIYDALSQYIDHYVKLSVRMAPDFRVPKVVQRLPKLVLKGFTYTTVKQSKKNSQIHYMDLIRQERCAGIIEEIFVHRRVQRREWVAEALFAVRPYRSLSPDLAMQDPYLKYPLLDVQLHHNSFGPMQVIAPDAILSHVATCCISYSPIGDDLIVIQSLDRELNELG